ncbi:very-short-patch-repair endonuclease [Tamaricihabitans halophyticus]|uniref:Very-short-patch-repair endonuclease n=2 Tax=Tamaricihabitans halophyticus TaxID=1262583 RepID=A0A4R2R444_9PSEU|nr:very-short-patch-repair endonuclease [Tamaricihabitans halophyticus]
MIKTAAPELTGPFRGSHARAEGLVTETQLRGRLFQRLFQDVYVPSNIPITHELRCRAVALVAPAETMLSGCSAMAIHGLDLANYWEPVEVILPSYARPNTRRGLDVRQRRLTRDECVPWQGIYLANPLRATIDMLTNFRLRRTLPSAVAPLDALLRAGFVDRKILAPALAHRNDHGIVWAREVFALADPRAESLPESELRVLLVLGGLHPVPQLEVRVAGRFVARLDLGFAEEKVAVEYDGEWHTAGAQPEHDHRRRARLTAAGWSVIVVTRRWLRDDPRGVIQAVREAIAARRGDAA